MTSLIVVLAMSLSSSPDPSEALLADVRDIREDVALATPQRLTFAFSLLRHWNTRSDFIGCDPLIRASIRITSEALWVGMNIGDRRIIQHIDGQPDWASLRATLDEYRELPAFEGRYDIELAAHSDITAEAIARAMRVAADSGFDDIGYTLPGIERADFSDLDDGW